MSRNSSRLLPRRATARLLTAGAVGALAAAGGVVVASPAQAAIPIPAAAKAHPTITVGERHAAVPYLKRRFAVPNTTRSYGKAIAAKVARFEQRRGWRDDNGTVTAATWRALGVPYVAPRTFGERVIAEASRHGGKQYSYGASGPATFDCSGFTQYVYRQVGASLPRTAAAQRGATTRISAANVRPGDLVFVHGSSGVYHAAIYAGPGVWWEAGNAATDVGKHRAWSSSVSYGRL